MLALIFCFQSVRRDLLTFLKWKRLATKWMLVIYFCIKTKGTLAPAHLCGFWGGGDVNKLCKVYYLDIVPCFTEVFPRFCCWTLIWLSRHWAWLCRGYWLYRSLIDWSIDWLFIWEWDTCSIYRYRPRSRVSSAVRVSSAPYWVIFGPPQTLCSYHGPGPHPPGWDALKWDQFSTESASQTWLNTGIFGAVMATGIVGMHAPKVLRMISEYVHEKSIEFFTHPTTHGMVCGSTRLLYTCQLIKFLDQLTFEIPTLIRVNPLCNELIQQRICCCHRRHIAIWNCRNIYVGTWNSSMVVKEITKKPKSATTIPHLLDVVHCWWQLSRTHVECRAVFRFINAPPSLHL